ncbi:hypothetical protein [Desulfopila sp. IMCC35008]|uniref:hypothetical protein n=1 Tax=Desulfopila sp. IMCC35008 TaxID=2653858 RepID=UPI0013D41FE5|nr:hypothetical protein [Desulfopila sp. IMCC35008]
MEIIVGSIPPLPAQPPKTPEKASPVIQARLLNVRPTRKGIAGPSGMERRNKQGKDPHKGRVLTIMVPDSDMLPADVDTREYNVHVRFVRK